MLVGRVLRGVLKIRYLVLGGAVGGSVTLNKVGDSFKCFPSAYFYYSLKKYEAWRDGLPDMNWLNEVFPDNEQWQKFSNGVINMTENIKNTIEIGELCICDTHKYSTNIAAHS